MNFGLHLGDCIAGMKSLPDGSVHLIATDPPYGVGYVTNHRDKRFDHNEISRPVVRDDAWEPEWFEVVVRECHRILASDTHLYIFGSDEVIDEQKRIVKEFFTFKNLLVWDKGNWSAGDLSGAYGKQTEFVIFAQKGRRALKKGRPPSLISVARVPPEHSVHSCQKPIALMAYLIENSTDPGEVVCDPFSGSGTTYLAAKGLGRKFIGWEVDPKTYAIAQKRISEDELQMRLF